MTGLMSECAGFFMLFINKFYVKNTPIRQKIS